LGRRATPGLDRFRPDEIAGLCGRIFLDQVTQVVEVEAALLFVEEVREWLGLVFSALVFLAGLARAVFVIISFSFGFKCWL